MVKYSLSLREIPRAGPKGFHYISLSIPTQNIIQKISKNDTYSIVLPGWEILKELIFFISLGACLYSKK